MATGKDDPRFDEGVTPVKVIAPHPTRTPPQLPPITDDAPEWYLHARAELGTHESQLDGKPNPRVHEYFQTTAFKAGDADDAWCSAFVNWCMQRSGIKGTGSAAARSWMRWGMALPKPRLGCIAVFWRGDPKAATGHVALYVGESVSTISVLGGNQHNQVCVAPYPRARLLGYRYPVGVK